MYHTNMAGAATKDEAKAAAGEQFSWRDWGQAVMGSLRAAADTFSDFLSNDAVDIAKHTHYVGCIFPALGYRAIADVATIPDALEGNPQGFNEKADHFDAAMDACLLGDDSRRRQEAFYQAIGLPSVEEAYGAPAQEQPPSTSNLPKINAELNETLREMRAKKAADAMALPAKRGAVKDAPPLPVPSPARPQPPPVPAHSPQR